MCRRPLPAVRCKSPDVAAAPPCSALPASGGPAMQTRQALMARAVWLDCGDGADGTVRAEVPAIARFFRQRPSGRLAMAWRRHSVPRRRLPVTIEKAVVRRVEKPWGRRDLSPWARTASNGAQIGELWFERPGEGAVSTRLLLKLLFTSEMLSIQVHPDDVTARSMGMRNGKSEAWVVLAADADARLGVGLSAPTEPDAVRAAIANGTVANLLRWHHPTIGDAVMVPAGTIHAIGAGLVLAEIQQRSDATFRLFDPGHNREVHIDAAMASAHLRPAAGTPSPASLGTARTVLLTSPHFVVERIRLSPGSRWVLKADAETWLLTLRGLAAAGAFQLSVGDGAFVENDRVRLVAGDDGADLLVAYASASAPTDLLLPAHIGVGEPESAPRPYTADSRSRPPVRLPGGLA
jgi:mannose-6-phosphate isomerase